MALFGSDSSNKPRKRKSNSVDTLIGSSTEIRGDVLFSGGLHVDGRIKGKVLANSGEEASLSISETGAIEGDVSVPILTVNGSVSGNVHASEQMILAPNARVTGNVFYSKLEVQGGAEVNGQMVHDPNGDRAPASMHDTRGDMSLTDVRDLRRPKLASS